MNPYIVVSLILILGIATHVMVRIYSPWSDKNQNFFWLFSFGPMVLTQLVALPNEISSYFIIPFFSGAILSEFLRIKLKPHYEKFQKTLHGQPERNTKNKPDGRPPAQKNKYHKK